MKVARFYASTAVFDRYIYVAGGEPALASVELYDPECDEWTDIKPMNRPRSAFALVALNGFLYAIGGNVAVIEKYDPNEACWTDVCI